MKAPNALGLKFHHLGLAVKNPEAAVKFLKGAGYEAGQMIRDPLQNVDAILFTGKEMPAVEVVFPTETPGPLTPILQGKSSMMYHTCYETDDLENSLRALEEGGNRVLLLSAPQPAPLFGGRKVSFYTVAGVGVIEILEPA